MEMCALCKFFFVIGSQGYCRRYPGVVAKRGDGNEWCGEFAFDAPVQPQVAPDHADKVRVLIAEYGMASSEWGKHWADMPHATFGEAYENALKTRAALFMVLGIEDI